MKTITLGGDASRKLEHQEKMPNENQHIRKTLNENKLIRRRHLIKISTIEEYYKLTSAVVPLTKTLSICLIKTGALGADANENWRIRRRCLFCDIVNVILIYSCAWMPGPQ